jgi:hypothetical protein
MALPNRQVSDHLNVCVPRVLQDAAHQFIKRCLFTLDNLGETRIGKDESPGNAALFVPRSSQPHDFFYFPVAAGRRQPASADVQA